MIRKWVPLERTQTKKENQNIAVEVLLDWIIRKFLVFGIESIMRNDYLM